MRLHIISIIWALTQVYLEQKLPIEILLSTIPPNSSPVFGRSVMTTTLKIFISRYFSCTLIFWELHFHCRVQNVSRSCAVQFRNVVFFKQGNSSVLISHGTTTYSQRCKTPIWLHHLLYSRSKPTVICPDATSVASFGWEDR